MSGYKAELTLRTFPELPLFISAYFSYWKEGNPGKESLVLEDNLGLQEESCGELQCTCASYNLFTSSESSDSGF